MTWEKTRLPEYIVWPSSRANYTHQSDLSIEVVPDGKDQFLTKYPQFSKF
jgi:hypothetical protein